MSTSNEKTVLNLKYGYTGNLKYSLGEALVIARRIYAHAEGIKKRRT